MNLPEDCHLAYSLHHEAWYFDAFRKGSAHDDRPQMSVVAQTYDHCGVAWEFTIGQYEIQGKPAVKVTLFDDSFVAFGQIPEFFAALRDNTPESLTGVRKILDDLGAVDETPRTRS